MKDKLDERRQNASFRQLSSGREGIDFFSNDYLGLAQNRAFQEYLQKSSSEKLYSQGATGSRLISGNHSLHDELEQEIANWSENEAALLFNSGYDANIGLYSSLLQRGDLIVYDELVHASIRDGIRLGFARSLSFSHNDISDLEKKLKEGASGRIWVAVESIYSMDGDEAPLRELVKTGKLYGAELIVDEAHTAGIFGDMGQGLCAKYHLEQHIFARLITFGKAFGTHGAAVVGSKELRSFLINFARSFIYTTALSPHQSRIIQLSLHHLSAQREMRESLMRKIIYFNSTLKELGLEPYFLQSISPIQSLLISGNERAGAVSQDLQKAGFAVKAIIHPTVPAGKERIRISLHLHNTNSEIKSLLEKIREIL
ncbi:MAG: aminotransferase class I/II-fold pyridoxal phosphate-dependent enzyme [Bacteroidetes bacterium]|nr:aminotransferase class I/II-fold pyridoxal phosphate-dependent enzyme [Bacteroidota bacterium]